MAFQEEDMGMYIKAIYMSLLNKNMFQDYF